MKKEIEVPDLQEKGGKQNTPHTLFLPPPQVPLLYEVALFSIPGA